MYNFIVGKLVEKYPESIIIETGGIGYELRIPLSTYEKIGDESSLKLYTYLHLKDGGQTLYGFYNKREKEVFLQLISISNVGPTAALMILSSLGVDEIIQAISTSNTKTIQSVRGIGAKTSQRIILELKDKFAGSSRFSEDPLVGGQGKPTFSIRNEALEALVALGIPKASAERNIQKIIHKKGNSITLEELIKLALKTN